MKRFSYAASFPIGSFDPAVGSVRCASMEIRLFMSQGFLSGLQLSRLAGQGFCLCHNFILMSFLFCSCSYPFLGHDAEFQCLIRFELFLLVCCLSAIPKATPG
jgi:hypothetical protein